jgi:hypothetical protein
MTPFSAGGADLFLGAKLRERRQAEVHIRRGSRLRETGAPRLQQDANPVRPTGKWRKLPQNRMAFDAERTTRTARGRVLK